MIPNSKLSSVLLVLLANHVHGFTSPIYGFPSSFFLGRGTLLQSSDTDIATAVPGESSSAADDTTNHQENREPGQSIRAPLKFMGPYPCLGLKFPNLATPSQRQRSVSGISLDFVLDTAANINTMNGPVAQELGLEVVGQALPGVTAGGTMNGAPTYMLGDCELEGLPKEEQFIFMQNLTASALPVASPAAAGLLSLSFLYSFEGGVEFQWNDQTQDGGPPPSVTFYGEGESDAILKEMTKVAIKELPITRLPSVEITINGVTIPALLDTGSPITVINAQAAEQAGIKTIEPSGAKSEGGGNLLAKIAGTFGQAQATAQAAARGDILTIAGSNGERIDLLKSKSDVNVEIVGTDENGDSVDFGTSKIYVGNIPGLAALNALGDNSPPAAVLGMDVLRKRSNMIFKARDSEVYF